MASTTTRTAKRKGQEKIGDQIKGATKHPWVEWLTRFGYVARGILVAAIGFVALQVALGHGGQPTDQTGALAAIAHEPYGRVLLSAIVVGLVGFSLWGFIRAIFDPLRRGDDTSGIIERIGFAISGISYGALVYPAVQLIIGSVGQPKSQTQTTQDVTAQLLAQPFGPWLVGAVGLGVIGWSIG